MFPSLFDQTKIIVIGIGGGGGNMISHLKNNNLNKEVSTIAINTDQQALDVCLADIKIPIGKDGLGAGANPDVAKKAAENKEDEIYDLIKKSDLVFIAAGLGGGTGTGAAPIVANIARKAGALVVSVITTPFSFEGKKRKKSAMAGLEKLEENSNSTIVIDNNNLLKIIEPKSGLKESFRKVDDILSKAIKGVTGVILSSGENDINLDFADLQTIMSHKGRSLMGIGKSEEGNANQAIKEALESPLIDNLNFSKSKGVLIHFNIHENYPFFQLGMAMEEFQEQLSDDCEVIFGTTTDNSLPEEEIQITLVATGIFEEEEEKAINPNTKKITEDVLLHNIKVMSANVTDHLDIPSYSRRMRS